MVQKIKFALCRKSDFIFYNNFTLFILREAENQIRTNFLNKIDLADSVN